MDQLLQNTMLMVRCPQLGSMSQVAATIIEEQLTKVISEYADIVEDGIRHAWLEESFHTQVRTHLFDEDGVARFTGAEDVYWNALKEPDMTVDHYAQEIDGWLTAIMDHNHELFLEISANFIVEHISIARAFPDLWILQLTGAKL